MDSDVDIAKDFYKASSPGKALGIAYQIPRNSLALLMVAQVVVILPLAAHISLWIIGVALFCGFWRTQVYLGRRGNPANWVKAVLVAASCFGVALTGVKLFSLEAATSLMVLAFALKLVEMKSRRDAYVVIFLGYFVIATAFLFDQSMMIAAYELVCRSRCDGCDGRDEPIANARPSGRFVVDRGWIGITSIALDLCPCSCWFLGLLRCGRCPFRQVRPRG